MTAAAADNSFLFGLQWTDLYRRWKHDFVSSSCYGKASPKKYSMCVGLTPPAGVSLLTYQLTLYFMSSSEDIFKHNHLKNPTTCTAINSTKLVRIRLWDWPWLFRNFVAPCFLEGSHVVEDPWNAVTQIGLSRCESPIYFHFFVDG